MSTRPKGVELVTPQIGVFLYPLSWLCKDPYRLRLGNPVFRSWRFNSLSSYWNIIKKYSFSFLSLVFTNISIPVSNVRHRKHSERHGSLLQGHHITVCFSSSFRIQLGSHHAALPSIFLMFISANPPVAHHSFLLLMSPLRWYSHTRVLDNVHHIASALSLSASFVGRTATAYFMLLGIGSLLLLIQ